MRPASWISIAVVEDRVAFLKTGHPEVNYAFGWNPRAANRRRRGSGERNSGESSGERGAGCRYGGNVLAVTHASNGHVAVEIHDSGPGLSEQARRTLFQPTISFKKNGMGLGLSIARKSALLSGGDIVPVAGELGGAAFRLVLPTWLTWHRKKF